MSLRDQYIQTLRSKPRTDVDEAEIRWQSPSNIALVKYWGKHGNQLPMNPSISFTLSQCKSDTHIRIRRKKNQNNRIDVQFSLDQTPMPAFANRVTNYMSSIADLFPFLTQYEFDIQSSNSFPHSAGIASSASGFSALALCLATLEDQLYSTLEDDVQFRKKASYLARLGSGSASRSIFGQAAWWGSHSLCADSSDKYAVGCADMLHPIFEDFQDSILIVSSDKKSISSSAGHQLMDYHPYREDRMKQVGHHLTDLKSALQLGDLEKFGLIIEREALSLHALMLSSSPGFFLVNGGTIDAINKLRAYRTSSQVPCYFTLDAGPNLHVLYPKRFKPQVTEFIENELNTTIDRVIYDVVGNGPVQLK